MTWHMLSTTETDFLNPVLNSVATNYSTSAAHYGKDGSEAAFLTKMFALIIAFHLHREPLGSPDPEPKPLVLSTNTSLFRRNIIDFNCPIPFWYLFLLPKKKERDVYFHLIFMTFHHMFFRAICSEQGYWKTLIVSVSNSQQSNKVLFVLYIFILTLLPQGPTLWFATLEK